MNPSVVLLRPGACRGWPRAGAAGWPSGRSRRPGQSRVRGEAGGLEPVHRVDAGRDVEVVLRVLDREVGRHPELHRRCRRAPEPGGARGDDVLRLDAGELGRPSAAMSSGPPTGKTVVDLRGLAVELDHGVPRNRRRQRPGRSRSSTRSARWHRRCPRESEPRASTTTTSSSPKSTPVDSSTSTRLNRVGAVCESGTSSSTAPTASAAMPRRSLLMTRLPEARVVGVDAGSRRSSTRRRPASASAARAA